MERSLTKFLNKWRRGPPPRFRSIIHRNFSSSVIADEENSHLPVLIVGAGPVGLTLSILLTKLGATDSQILLAIEFSDGFPPPAYNWLREAHVKATIAGVKCAVLEKSLFFSRHPQAHFINIRSMEVFHKLDGLAEEIQKLQPPLHQWRKFVYCTSLSGSVLGSVDHMQPQDFEKIASPVSVAHLSQYKLVDLLLNKLKNMGFHFCIPDEYEGQAHNKIPKNRVFMGFECISIHPTAQGVRVGASFIKEGRVEERNFDCRILVGSDGARSTVRKLAGIELKGERDLQNLVSVHFLSRDLGQYLLHQRPGMLFFIFNPEAIGVLVAHDLDQGEFVLQIPYYPPQQSFQNFTSKVCEQIIFKLVGFKLEDVEVVDIKPWVMNAEVAEEFVSCNNQVILAGDAAHRFPPAGGFGMNTGIQDAHNLAWKISCLLNGVASPSIISTYETERKPIAIFNTELSVRNFEAAMSVPAALGLDPTIANSVHQVINSGPSSFLPSSFQKAVLEGIFSIGRAQLSEFILNENNPLGSSRLARVRSIFDEGKSLQLQFPAEDLGFRYLEGALVADFGGKTQQTVETDTDNRRGSRAYVPSSKPGSRLPHMLLRTLNASSIEETFSTLDLVPIDKPEFLLIIAPLKDSYDIACAAFKVAKTFKVSLKVCIIWPQGSAHTNASGSGKELEPWKNYVDAEEVTKPRSKSWWEMCEMTNKGIILVRPDDHIGWSTEIDVVDQSVQQLERVFSTILGVETTSL